MALVSIGVEFGQGHSPSAIAVAEVEERKTDRWWENHFKIRYLERLPIGTTYPAIAERVTRLVQTLRSRHRATILLYLNATGIGTPVMDMIRRQPISARVWDVYFNHGDRRVVVDDREIRLGKAFVVSRLKTLLQAHRIHLPPSPEARILAEELMEYEVKVSEDANDRYGAFKVGSQDDLVTALGLALQDDGPRRAIIPGR